MSSDDSKPLAEIPPADNTTAQPTEGAQLTKREKLYLGAAAAGVLVGAAADPVIDGINTARIQAQSNRRPLIKPVATAGAATDQWIAKTIGENNANIGLSEAARTKAAMDMIQDGQLSEIRSKMMAVAEHEYRKGPDELIGETDKRALYESLERHSKDAKLADGQPVKDALKAIMLPKPETYVETSASLPSGARGRT